MAETDYYPRFGGDAPSGGGPAPPPKPPGKEQDKEGEYDTFLVSKSALGGKTYRPGDTVTMEVEHVWDDEIEFCVSDGTEEKPDTETESKPMSADEELDGMDMMKG